MKKMNNECDFLQFNTKIIKKAIKDIDDSYNNYWDILAELVQNSVDAINLKEDPKGKIEIEIDCIRREIRIKDDGIGFDDEKISELLTPFSTDKENDYRSIGEKGVGLSFAIFQSNIFTLKTSRLGVDKTSYIEIKGARNWKESSDNEKIYMKRPPTNEVFNGTEITLGELENEELFNLTINEMIYILRTRTAIGNTKAIFEKNSNIEVFFKMTDSEGNKNGEGQTIPYKYWLPIENIPIRNKIDFKDLELWATQAMRKKEDIIEKIREKVIYSTDEEYIEVAGKRVKYFACIVPQRKYWNIIGKRDGLIPNDEDNDKKLIEEGIYKMHRPGIYISVKGMPTGITIEHPNTGYLGYWANMFIIIEAPNNRLDIGRKSIDSRTKKIYKEAAKIIFNNYLKYAKYIKIEDDPDDGDDWGRAEVIEKINQIPTLDTNIVKFEKIPYDQEASVAAIFYELIGAGYIKEIRPIISGYKYKYDLYAYYDKKIIVMEFKSYLRNILSDFDNLTKFSNNIDYIVCWDVNDKDITEMHAASLELKELTRNKVGILKWATHEIIIAPSIKPVYVIDLKRVINDIEQENTIETL